MAFVGKRRNYLINPSFQLRYILYVTSWTVGLFVAFPFIIRDIFAMFLKVAAIDPVGPSSESLAMIRHDLLGFLGLMEAIFALVVIIMSLFVSHRIAGPLHKLKQYFRKVREGDLASELRFRKGDYFQEIATEFNQTLAVLRKEREGAEKALQHIDQAIAETSGAARKQLETARTLLARSASTANEPSL